MKILFITDIHQNIQSLKTMKFDQYDAVICGGDIIDPARKDLAVANQIVDLLPEGTFIVPGNCDTDEQLRAKIASMPHYIERTIRVAAPGVPIGGIGMARSLVEDIAVYRNFFSEDRSRIDRFLELNGSAFILKFAGINQDGTIVDNRETIENNAAFFNNFISFDEDEIQHLFGNDALLGGIMLTHSPPHGALDQLPGLPHIGSEKIAESIKHARPSLVLCGHFHELGGSATLYGARVFNPGAVKDGYYGEIEYNGNTYQCTKKSFNNKGIL